MQSAREIRAVYPNIPDHSDLRGFSYRAPENYQWSDDHQERATNPCQSSGRTSENGRAGEHSLWHSVKSFLGRGPKGYRRRDERIFEDVCEALMRHPGIDASEIEVSVADGVLLLRGLVPDRWMKRAAEWVSEDVPGVREVRNELSIQRSPLRP